MKITAKELRDKQACKSQLERFVHLFGEGPVDVTAALCVEHASLFDWDWAARALLPAPAKAEYGRMRVVALAWAEYAQVTAQAFGTLAEVAEK